MRPRAAPFTIQALLLALLVGIGTARAAPPVLRDPSKLAPGTYQVQADHTQVLFSVLHMGFTSYYGFLSQASGTLSLAPADLSRTTLAVSVKAASLATTSAKLDGILKGPDWLDAGRFPSIDFRSTTVTQTGPNAADISGRLTLHGVTRDATLHATFVGAGTNLLTGGENIGFQGSLSVHRRDFGVTALPLLVGDEVQVAIAAAFER